jgi:di/tripeptidase
MTQEINFEKGFHDVVEGVSAIGVSMIHFTQKLNNTDKDEMTEFDQGRTAGALMVADVVRESVLLVLKSVENVLISVLPEDGREAARQVFNRVSGNETIQ